MSLLTERLLNAQYHNHEEDCCCGEECCCHDHEEKEIEQQLSEEEIKKIIEEKYSEKDEKTKEFIRKGLRKFGDRFDYSKTEYVRAKDKVIITCLNEDHGDFKITPDHFLRRGCPSCRWEKANRARSLDNETFIKKAREIHGDKYNYDEVNYVNSTTNVVIICPIHGKFEQLPTNHLSGKGCLKCGIIQRSNIRRSNNQRFIESAKLIHGDKYNYDEVNYVNNNTKVIIICPIHGKFEQVPSSHLMGKGCPKCAANVKLTNDDFITRANEVHGEGTYIYDKINYINIHTPVEIYDPIYKEYFFQEPINHLLGHGNPNRSMSFGERQVYIWLKNLNIVFEKEVWLENTYGRHGNRIRVDFMIPLYNTNKIIVEYNGQQHYKLISYYHTQDEFEAQLSRDRELRDYCKTNSIYLIEIPYTINTPQSISNFLTKTIIENIDPHTLVDFDSLYVLEDDNST